ncbi:hypothetical protein AJ79_01181 [Helicocarpus griseus UAMH5409]|uniref:Uncharacterized protein n=1 Tax=Helicocarpus griseus UAMH5409 TaxID=1447875 RepID=A0A2B7Y9L5_9EURO|nr:hypothetical protein AJ79_01181 [Helicocarpus griseus UAMH5409]
MPENLPLTKRGDSVNRPDDDPDALILEGWAQGFMVGALVIMTAITIANMRRRVLLHKLILAELILGMFHGTWLFAHKPVYGWYLSTTAIGLNISWSLHNVIAWMKNKPFLGKKVSLFYIGTVILVQPYWVLEIYANFTYFNRINDIFLKTRPLETLFRDPWWIYTTCSLFWVIKSQYDFTLVELVRESPRFGIMLLSMCLSIAFLIVDLLSVVRVFEGTLPIGVNPFWKLAFVFKCLCDAVILDDFKTALDRLRDYWLVKNGAMDQLGSFEHRQSRRPRSGPREAHINLSNGSIRRPDPAAAIEGRTSYSLQHSRTFSNSASTPMLPESGIKDRDRYLEEV